MKTLKTLCVLLLMVTGAMAQINPDNMFISGYIVDTNGQAQAGATVCVSYVSNSPVLPSDTVCTNTNSNGYYFIDITNGSLSGPNVYFEVTTYDSCSFLPLSQTVINAQGTIDTAIVNFTLCATGGCNLSVNITSSYDSLNNIYTYDAGAGFTSYAWLSGETTQTIQSQLDSACVTVTDANGCIGGDCAYGSGVSPCGGYVELSTNPTGGLTLSAVPTGGAAPYSYFWDTASTAQQIVVTTAGNYCVTVTDAVGCSFVICRTVSNANLCSVEITTTVDSTGGGLVYTLNGGNGYPSYFWSTGEVSSEITVQNVSPNGEVICLTVEDGNGCTATDCDTIYAGGNPNPCGGYVQSSTNPNGTTTLSAVATGGTPPYDYNWLTGATTPQITVLNPGTYCVIITDATGCAYTTCDTVGCTGVNPNPQITTTVDSTGGGLVYVLDSPPGYSAYYWSDGSFAQTTTVQNVGPNGEVICLTVVDQFGCTATTCDTLLPINPSGCQAGFSYQSGPNGELLVGDTVQLFFDGVAGSSSTYSWTLSAGGFSFNATGMNPYYVIPPTLLPVNGMNVEICVTVTDSVANCTDTYCETVLAVPSNNNNCGGTITTTVDSTLLGVTYTFTANATGIAPFMYNWFNGDSSQSIVIESSQIPWGNACVAITDATGCTITVCDTLSPNNNNCQANYSWEINTALGVPLTGVQFTDLSLGNATFWYWEFGDGATSTDQNPLHLYNGDGPFTVCLTVVTANQQCQSTYCDSLYLGTNPGNCSALFTNSGLTPIGYTFSANVQNPNLDYYWTIDNQYGGDGYEAYAPGLTNGVHTVCLSVVDSLNNCFDQQCQTITIGSPNCYGYISGQVYAGTNNQPLFDGVVYLITFDANTNQLTVVDSIVLDTSNSFFFGALACGDYLIKAAAYSGSPYYSNHIPTYHGNSPFWGLAQTLTLGQVNTQITADVTLIAANNPGGPGFIGGDVTQGANKTDPGDPLSGIQVMLFNLNGGAIAYTYTDENGEFGFADLAYGTYQVYVEVLGVQTIPAVVTIGPDEPSEENVHIFASETLISTGIEEVDFDGAISNVYPNPVVNEASITFNLDAEVIINVSVLDLTGRAISTQMVSIAGGENTLRVNSENLQNGYYFLNIQDVEGNFSVTRKFMRID